MAGIPSIKDIESMSPDQIESILYSSARELAVNPTDKEARTTFSLLNDYAVRKWLIAAARKGKQG